MAESGLTKNRIIAELSKSKHGTLAEYVPIGQQAAKQDPEFLAHLIAWDHKKEQIRDAKIALPVISFSVAEFPEGLVENSLAHLAKLGPRGLDRAMRFRREQGFAGKYKVRRVVDRYLRDLESDWRGFDRVGILHHDTLKSLYAFSHLKPSERADKILFKCEYPSGSIFEAVSRLHRMSPLEAAAAILQRQLPYMAVAGAVNAKDPDIALALIQRMTQSELVTNTKIFMETFGHKNNPAVRGAYEKAIEEAGGAKRQKNILKTTRAAETVQSDVLKEKLRGLQERQLASMGIEGDWLVLGDKSGSMSVAIEMATHVASTLARMVKGKVWLIFFDTAPQTLDVTGLPLDEIKKATKYIKAEGGTSIGCGVQRMLESGENIDGIAIVSDAQENSAPLFQDAYKKLCAKLEKDIPVYLYRVGPSSRGHADRDLGEAMRSAHMDLQEFDLRGQDVDYYSLPNLVTTMRTNRYSLIDEVMATPLLTLDDVFGKSLSQAKRMHHMQEAVLEQ